MELFAIATTITERECDEHDCPLSFKFRDVESPVSRVTESSGAGSSLDSVSRLTGA